VPDWRPSKTRRSSTARWGREYLRENVPTRSWPGGGNFVLFEVGDATAVFEACKRRGVIVRDCTSFGLPDCVRATTGTREETKEAAETLTAVLEEAEL
jgi:histidinol-phosphate aminotransferase